MITEILEILFKEKKRASEDCDIIKNKVALDKIPSYYETDAMLEVQKIQSCIDFVITNKEEICLKVNNTKQFISGSFDCENNTTKWSLLNELWIKNLNNKLHKLNVEYNAEKTLFEHVSLCNKSLRQRLNLSAIINLIFIVLITAKCYGLWK